MPQSFKSTSFFLNYLSLVYSCNYPAGRPVQTLYESFKGYEWAVETKKASASIQGITCVRRLSGEQRCEYPFPKRRERNMKRKCACRKPKQTGQFHLVARGDQSPSSLWCPFIWEPLGTLLWMCLLTLCPETRPTNGQDDG